MAIASQQLQALVTGSEAARIEHLRQLLGYPLQERDEQGSRFWYLRAGEDLDEAAETAPVAVGFYAELDGVTDLRAYFTKEAAGTEICAHYLNRVNEQQPILYLLLPMTAAGTVLAVLPKDWGKNKGIRQRDLLVMPFEGEEFGKFLARLGQESIAKLRQRVEDQFLAYVPLVDFLFVPVSKTAKDLAEALAGIAREMEQQIPKVYKLEEKSGYLHRLLESFKKELLPNLKVSSENQKDYSFADVYAQTIAYGLFTARVFGFIGDEAAEFTLTGAWACLPETNPFLKQLFRDLSHEDLGAVLNNCLAKISLLLERAEMRDILADFQQKLDREDIVIRFYEDFLAAYKPQMRERRGVYYTPEPVVSYMVRSVDELIKDKFGKPLGIADPEVKILDPACGTGTFLLCIFRLIHQRFVEDPAAFVGFTDWNEYVCKGLLPRIYGFELLVAPYAICHLKLGLFLEETGYKFDSGQRLGVYLINTLEDIQLREEQAQLSLSLPQMEEMIAAEAKAGSRVKKQEPIMVVIGNPPYSYESSNKGEWISNLVRDYYKVDGQDLGERNPKGLQDDYVKFIRFAQWRIDQSKQGILAFITNHGFLDNPTFRGMRQSLINSFDGISIYDLHGNSKKKETCPDGSKDENVFDIQQGVSITLATKGKDKYLCHAHLFGSRDYKYDFLAREKCEVNFQFFENKSPFYLLNPQDQSVAPEYTSLTSITDTFEKYSTGILTARDHFVIQDSSKKLWEILQDFIRLPIEAARQKYDLRDDVRDWKVELAQKDIIDSGNSKDKIFPYLYRPFDSFYTYFTGNSRGIHCTPRGEVMKQMAYFENLALVTVRQVAEGVFNHVLVSNTLVDHRVTVSNKGYSTIFPLYFNQKNSLKVSHKKQESNFSEDFLKKVEIKLGYLPKPEEIFYYIYGVFHSPTYRSRYAEFLKIDFPRVPLTSNKELFKQLADYGEQLTQLHLMTSPILEVGWGDLAYIDNGGNREIAMGSAKTAWKEGFVKINKKGDGFSGVPEHIWNFYIGGYQVCHKWLKDRKGRTLSDADITHYKKIIIALTETDKLMQKIDEAIPSFPIE